MSSICRGSCLSQAKRKVQVVFWLPCSTALQPSLSIEESERNESTKSIKQDHRAKSKSLAFVIAKSVRFSRIMLYCINQPYCEGVLLFGSTVIFIYNPPNNSPSPKRASTPRRFVKTVKKQYRPFKKKYSGKSNFIYFVKRVSLSAILLIYFLIEQNNISLAYVTWTNWKST